MSLTNKGCTNAHNRKPQRGCPAQGEQQEIFQLIFSETERQELGQQAAELATILIDLHDRFPLFFYEPAANDPDLDMDIGFHTFGRQEVVI